MSETDIRIPKRIHRTDRSPVTHVEAEDAYVIELPTDIEDVYKGNAAHIHFYRPDEADPCDSFEMTFAEKRIDEIEALELPDDDCAGCDFEAVLLYHPAVGLPYETVREEVTELHPAEELDGRVTAASALVTADELDHVDYLRIGVRDPETDEYVAGDVVPIDGTDDRDSDDASLLASGTVQVFPSDFAGVEAELTYLASSG